MLPERQTISPIPPMASLVDESGLARKNAGKLRAFASQEQAPVVFASHQISETIPSPTPNSSQSLAVAVDTLVGVVEANGGQPLASGDYQRLVAAKDKLNEIIVGEEENHRVKIDWNYVRDVVEKAASELNWDVEISVDAAENHIIVGMPKDEDQEDMIIETTFDFYSLIARQLDKEIFKAINFFFFSDFDEQDFRLL